MVGLRGGNVGQRDAVDVRLRSDPRSRAYLVSDTYSPIIAESSLVDIPFAIPPYAP